MAVSSDNAGRCDGLGSNFSGVDDAVARDGIAGGTPGIAGGGCFGGATDDAGDADLGRDGVEAFAPLPSDGGKLLHWDVRACADSAATDGHGARVMFRCLSREPSKRALLKGGAPRLAIGICTFVVGLGLSALSALP